MIPNGSTPIKNEILTDILAKGLLSKDEMRIAFYIIRWSWGFIGKDKRQDWTRPLQQKKIAEDIEMDKGLLSRNLKKMVRENKLLEKDSCYQFNEHYDQWIKVDKKSTKSTEKSDEKLTNSQLKVDKKSTKVDKKSTGTGVKGSNNKRLLKFKETLKETIKKKGDIFLTTFKEFKKMRTANGKKMTEYAEYLMLLKLNRMTTDENEQIKILEQSIEKVWQDVYPLKDQPQEIESQYAELR